MKKTKRSFILCLFLLSYCFSCNNARNINTTDNSKEIPQIDSASYYRGLEHAIEEKLLPKYKDSIK